MSKPKSNAKRLHTMFILYDGRAKCPDYHDGGQEAMILDTADSELEADNVGKTHHGEDVIWWEYVVSADGKALVSPRQRWDLAPNKEKP